MDKPGARNRARIYLAGPEVFLPDATAFGRRKVEICAAHGLEGVFPLDNQLDLDGLDRREHSSVVSIDLRCARTGLRPSCDEDVEISRGIGNHGVALLEAIAQRKHDGVVNVLTHCNAGSLATINYGTATAPIYFAQQRGIDVHVWVDETRPRNQGSQLTAWELAESGVPHTLIVDNAGGHLMQHGLVDIVITGTDRTTRCGDVANKIGTYLKALAARDNEIPFYIALPSTTIDWNSRDGIREIPIEERDPKEVSHIHGVVNGKRTVVRTTAENTPVSNYAFDVTPARLVTGLITERGICEASEEGLLGLFPEMRHS